MSNNETLVASEPAVEVIDTQTVDLSQMSEADYTYQRADGTIERALSAEDAIARCPVLGRLAIEAPEQANLLLELAAAGKEKMAAEAREQQKPEPDEAEIEEKKFSEITNPDKPIAKLKSEQLSIAKSVVPDSEMLAVEQQQARVLTHQEELQHHLRSQQREPVEESAIKPRPHTKVTTTVADTIGVSRNKTTTPIETIGDRLRQRQQVEAEAANLLTTGTQDAGNVPQGVREIGSPASETGVADRVAFSIESDDAVGANSELAEMMEATADTLDIEVLIAEDEITYTEAVVETGEATDEQLEVLFDLETIETYNRLVALTNMEASQPATVGILEIEDTIVARPELEAGAEAAVLPDFETFVASNPTGEKAVTLEVIQEQANEQQLEQTFIQLVEHLSETTQEAEQNAIFDVLTEIEAALPACCIEQERGETKLQITPEMTEKILMLLRALGYENPRETLVGFVDQFGLAFLLQALRYICQLNSDDNGQEFLVASAVAIANDDDVVRLRLGKLLFGLITRIALEPSM